MDPPDFGHLLVFLVRKKMIPVSIDNDPEIYLFYGPKWIHVLCYVLKFLYSSDDAENDATLKKTMGLLGDIASEYVKKKTRQLLAKAILQDFLPHLQKFFVVPAKMPSVLQLNQNEKLAGFLGFILQLWDAEAKRFGDMEGEEDEISKMPGLVQKNQRYSFLHKELKFLLTYLGDVPFQCCTTHQDLLDTLLAELEILANQVGHFTLFFILASRSGRWTEFSAGLDTLMHKVELLNENIKTYCVKFSELIPVPVPISQRVTRPIDSLFIIDSLLEDLESLINRRFHVTINVDMDEQIATLYEELKLSRIFLKDAELIPRETYSDWLNECVIVIRETVYEAEFLINSYIVGNIPTWYLRLRLPAAIHILKLKRSRLHEIKSSADEVLQVTKDFAGKSSLQLMKTVSTVVEDHLVGIEKSKNEILAHLTGNQKALKNISVLGMPGLGKTTLAKHLFGSSSVQKHFDRRAWCVISQIYERRKVLVDILMSISKDENKESLMAMDDETLGLKIHKSLYKRRYLIIVDDIWSSSTWDEIKNYFPDNSNGSRIMFTSRNKDAAPKESIFYTVPLLSVDECLDLLLQKVFVNKSCPPCLLDIGKRITKGCHGLPLAVVAIAGILATLDKEESAWEKVEKDLGAFILNEHEGFMKFLDYSYEHLPDHLKLCYLYLGTFPEDAEIPVRKIKRLWIAEGFIQKEDKKTPENVADEYLHDLINRSLLLIAKRKFDGSTKSCGIHDLLRDMCLRKIDGENFMKSTKEPFSLYLRHHRLRIDSASLLLSSHFGLHCRSFSGHLSAGSSCFPQMPLHRVIHLLPAITYTEALEGIDMLVHLRYLCSGDRFFSPRSASNLVNLEVLHVFFGYNEIAFSIILKMRKLKHLKITSGYPRIINDCDSCPITNLQSLSGIEISDLGDEKILKCSPHLRSLKFICNLSKFPDIGSLSKLETLRIRFGGDVTINNLATVNFPSAMKKLTLGSFGSGAGLSWDAISIIGRLPNLQVLKLSCNVIVGEEWETRDGEFQKLKFLQLDRFTDFEHWITCSEHFPELQCLVLQDCFKLQNVPNDLGNIPTLQLIEVIGCIYKLYESVVQIEAEQHEMGNEELEVKIINEFCSKELLLLGYKDLKQAFNRYKDKYDCIITTNELGAAMRSLTGGHSPSEAELETMMNEVDGTIDFPYFLNLMAEIRVPYSEKMLQKAFKFINLRGFITAFELVTGLKRLGQMVTHDEADKMVRESDINSDGELDYPEFKKLMMTIDIPRPNELRRALLMAFMSEGTDVDAEDDDYDDDERTLTPHVSLTHFSHPHQLQPIFTDQILQSNYCYGCSRRSSATMYTCQPCNFVLHLSCAKLPELITIPCHVGCTLSFLPVPCYTGGVFYCDYCSLIGDGWSYHCKRCKYDLHISCASKQLRVKNKMV